MAVGVTTTQASEIREQVRERYAAAAAQVTTSDPGTGCCAPSETFDGGSEVFGAALYALGDHEQLPDTAKLASLGGGWGGAGGGGRAREGEGCAARRRPEGGGREGRA